MPLKMPNGYAIRVFDTVDTVDSQYSIVDFGVQHPDGGIDSIAVGGSFYSARKAYDNWMSDVDKEADSKEAAAHATHEATKASDS